MSSHNNVALSAPSSEHSQLDTEVGACLPVMSVVTKQLTDVSQIVESSVVSACSRFAPMTRQIQQLNLPVVRHEVGSLHQLMLEQTELNTRLLAMLSLQIERHQCDQEVPSSSDSRQTCQELNAVHKLLSEAGTLAAEMHRITISVDAHVHSIMRLTDGLQGDILGCVSDMQFQDAISQRLDHLVNVLQGMSQAICERLSLTELPAGDASNPWLKMLAATYTMDSERQMHAPKHCSPVRRYQCRY
jgi:hypothetical protein